MENSMDNDMDVAGLVRFESVEGSTKSEEFHHMCYSLNP